jgi:hypothetical protein
MKNTTESIYKQKETEAKGVRKEKQTTQPHQRERTKQKPFMHSFKPSSSSYKRYGHIDALIETSLY